MDGKRDYGQPLPDDVLRDALNDFHNKWFQKWKTSKTEREYDDAITEWMQLLRRYEFGKYPTVQHIAITAFYEFDGRYHHGFTESTSRKLLSLLEAEAGRDNTFLGDSSSATRGITCNS